ncbi:N-6 DNA methylase [Tsuneonella sp. YG55]|uniref:site-specific DNA-methyltransferase (adenine-specific) n=1 Tax=Tsuneonella litorea TaxID=2976475 RepID=A0A9X3A6P2_9SPHN|nr:N-6 DNA methylase [Tsuneonella litorea]MCT2557536.1 N-6 DNA methylase [Tsuneonella litorea]
MSQHLINEYRAELDRLRAASGSRRESVLREAFKDLLKRWGRAQDLQFIAEHDILTKQMTRIYVDGALLHGLRVPFGYWEAKDESDDLDKEIEAKFRKGYPKDNIVFTDDATAILWQDGAEVLRAKMQADDDSLLNLLTVFFAHERKEVADFNKAVKQFAADLPHVLAALRERIAEKNAQSREFAAAAQAFLKHARDAINPAVSEDDVREMLIQHILTEDIFAKVFDNPDFHQQNNVAAELKKLEDVLFKRGEKSTLLRALAPYYAGIASTAALIQSHSEKQGFLKALYEDFYKAYNRKAADRLGVVYTPGEIVRFMIRSADWLCEKHFGKNLIDRGVEILDPATGTGTFIVELLEHFRGNHDKLRHKYKEELHANEVAILPYYVANLNIEATYQAITGQFAEFENLCLVDTLDNVDALGIHSGHQFDLLGSLSDENIERIKRQNRRKISVIIGNPPYNANQQNENDDNKNRAYGHIDKRIKNTYIKESNAKKPKAYDMYARFYRWAADRLSDEGIVAFITNRSFLWAKTYDGFRKLALRDFAEIWVCDLGGDWKQKGDGGGANVFGISTGVAICFLVKKKKSSADRIHYGSQSHTLALEDKLSAIAHGNLGDVSATEVRPDNLGYWIDPGHPDFGQHIPMISEKTKKAKGPRGIDAIFREFTNGINTARDSWVYGIKDADVSSKISFFGSIYNAHRDGKKFDTSIKWSRNLKKRRKSGVRDSFSGKEFSAIIYFT